ncbi:uncharacterized protein LOC123537784 isoform X2 [Mercenaria mercenaria]|uniref:uncharacterized protein LOC123537784 isoform X2 n=1 Tax=Mercenaria mercenaria TaxID=6596 RepID=UPI00234E81F1|nr:uncharacterized protein LOC123537784 isoform X2 [Mercenaria mercenaria]
MTNCIIVFLEIKAVIMQCLRNGIIISATLIFCMTELLPLTTGGGLPEHCTQTVVYRKRLKSYDIILSRLNDSEFPEPPADTDDIKVDICPNNTVLRFSWKMNRGQGTEMKLCYRMKSMFNGQLLKFSCVRFHVQYSKRRKQMTCRFPMYYFSSRPIINVLATSLDDGNELFYYGELNTGGLDTTDSCRHVCDVRAIEINAVMSCNAKSSIIYKDSVSIVRLSFDPINSDSCGDTSVQISGKTSNKLDYSINCTHKGLGVVNVLYNIHGYYCYKNHTVRVICDSISTTTTFLATTESHVDKIQSLVIFGTSCLVITVVIICIGNRVNRYGSEIVLPQLNNLRHFEGSVSSSSSNVTTQL